MKRKRKSGLAFVVIGLVAGGCYAWLNRGLAPTPMASAGYIRWSHANSLQAVLQDLQERQIIRSASAARLYGWLVRAPSSVPAGTYKLGPGMQVGQILEILKKPIRQMVRVPETNWANRTAHLLQKKEILSADEYMNLVHHPAQFQSTVSFPLPKTSLEGYLYPDTYDFPPLLGARSVIERQLKTFEKKVWDRFPHTADLQTVLTKASLVELESGSKADKRMIAGVIDNRLQKKMRLQIDASLLYGIQKWRVLTVADYKNIDSPYNLYTHDGLPPGPICSPTIQSIEAVLNPAKHKDIYYVALPNGSTLFAETFEQHKHNIRERLKAIKEQSTE